MLLFGRPNNMSNRYHTLQTQTERFLTWHKARKERVKIKQAAKNSVVSWIESFLWAAVVVLFLNQFLIQAYVIPSGSMIPTLEIGDRIFVNKAVFGPELIPGYGKLPGFRSPQRDEIVIFENPSYESRPPAVELFHRLVFMLTLSLVNLDRDEFGRPREQFLIKRAAAYEGDRLRIMDGEHEFRARGESRWMSEEEHRELHGLGYPIQRLVEESSMRAFVEAGNARALADLGLSVPRELRDAVARASDAPVTDRFALNEGYNATRYRASPNSSRFERLHHEAVVGWYVPDGHIMGLGDNRDNSRDGRDFGPVPLDEVLGRAMVRYWPAGRIGAIR